MSPSSHSMRMRVGCRMSPGAANALQSSPSARSRSRSHAAAAARPRSLTRQARGVADGRRHHAPPPVLVDHGHPLARDIDQALVRAGCAYRAAPAAAVLRPARRRATLDEREQHANASATRLRVDARFIGVALEIAIHRGDEHGGGPAVRLVVDSVVVARRPRRLHLLQRHAVVDHARRRGRGRSSPCRGSSRLQSRR